MRGVSQFVFFNLISLSLSKEIVTVKKKKKKRKRKGQKVRCKWDLESHAGHLPTRSSDAQLEPRTHEPRTSGKATGLMRA